MLDFIRVKLISYLKSAKLLYFAVVIIAFVIARGIFPLSFNQEYSEVRDLDRISLQSKTQETSTLAMYQESILLTTTTVSEIPPQEMLMPSIPIPSDFDNTKLISSRPKDERKAFGNSNGLGYTIEEFNQLSEQQLLAFHGVGAVTARSIVVLRSERGGFQTFDELLDVRGIGPAKLKKILGERDETN